MPRFDEPEMTLISTRVPSDAVWRLAQLSKAREVSPTALLRDMVVAALDEAGVPRAPGAKGTQP